MNTANSILSHFLNSELNPIKKKFVAGGTTNNPPKEDPYKGTKAAGTADDPKNPPVLEIPVIIIADI